MRNLLWAAQLLQSVALGMSGLTVQGRREWVAFTELIHKYGLSVCLRIWEKGTCACIGMGGSSESGIVKLAILSAFDVCGLKYLIQGNIYVFANFGLKLS